MVSKESYLISEVPHTLDLKTKILPYRKQEEVLDRILKERMATILPKVMKRSGIDTWVVACNEYNEDPLLFSLTPCAMFTARRLTILVFHLNEDDSVKAMALTRPNVGLDSLYESVWVNQKGSKWCKDPSKAETQMECLNRILTECNSKRIGINVSKDFAFADGLSKSLYDEIYAALSIENRQKLTSAEKLAVGWLESRSKSEMEAYNGIMEIAHTMIKEAFSSRVILPGVTTNLDVKYFMLQTVIDLGLKPWFDFEVSILRKDVGKIEDEAIILKGDVLHCDVGLTYLRLCTDTQENAYVLKDGEDDAPDHLKKMLHDTNLFQDIVVSCIKEGKSGNEVLKEALNEGKKQGLRPCLYTHPIGYHGHAAGPTIGLYDKQEGVPYNGDYLIYNDTAYSLELNCAFDSEEMGFDVYFGLETDILFTDDKVHYLGGRQTEFHLIK